MPGGPGGPDGGGAGAPIAAAADIMASGGIPGGGPGGIPGGGPECLERRHARGRRPHHAGRRRAAHSRRWRAYRRQAGRRGRSKRERRHRRLLDEAAADDGLGRLGVDRRQHHFGVGVEDVEDAGLSLLSEGDLGGLPHAGTGDRQVATVDLDDFPAARTPVLFSAFSVGEGPLPPVDVDVFFSGDIRRRGVGAAGLRRDRVDVRRALL